MPDNKKDKIVRFVSDTEMAKAVHGVILKSFLKSPKDREVMYLAASRIALDLLDDAWKELAKYKMESDREEKPFSNIGI